MPVITIAGQLGSSHDDIGRGLASRLQAPCINIDEDIAEDVARYLQVPPGEVEEMQDVPASLPRRVMSSFMRGLARAGATGVAPGVAPSVMTWIPMRSYVTLPLSEPQYKEGVEEVVRRLASRGTIVLLGRGAQRILADWPGAVHFFVTAPLRARVKRLMEQKQLTEREARTRIAAEDGSHKAYVKNFFGADIKDVGLYDLVLNTARVCTDAAIDFILSFVVARSDCGEAQATKANAS